MPMATSRITEPNMASFPHYFLYGL